MKKENHLKTLSTLELIKSCARNTQDYYAWAEFCNRFDATIRRGIFRFKDLLVNHKDSEFRSKILEDLMQDVYVQLVKNDCKALKNFRGNNENSFYLYLCIICKNTVLNYQKSKRCQTDKIPVLEEPDKSPILGEDIDIGYDLRKYIHSFVKGKHKERDRLILTLHFVDGFSSEEISAIAAIKLSPKRIANLISQFKNYIKKIQSYHDFLGKKGD